MKNESWKRPTTPEGNAVDTLHMFAWVVLVVSLHIIIISIIGSIMLGNNLFIELLFGGVIAALIQLSVPYFKQPDEVEVGPVLLHTIGLAIGAFILLDICDIYMGLSAFLFAPVYIWPLSVFMMTRDAKRRLKTNLIEGETVNELQLEPIVHNVTAAETKHRIKSRKEIIYVIATVLLAGFIVGGVLLYYELNEANSTNESTTSEETEHDYYHDARWVYRNVVFTKDGDSKYHKADCNKIDDASVYVSLRGDEYLEDYSACELCEDNKASDADDTTLDWLYESLILTTNKDDYYHRINCDHTNGENMGFEVYWLDYKNEIDGKSACPDCMD